MVLVAIASANNAKNISPDMSLLCATILISFSVLCKTIEDKK